MATSGELIQAAIEAKFVELAAAKGIAIDLDKAPTTRLLFEAIGKALYPELQKLQDTAGQPPSPGHV